MMQNSLDVLAQLGQGALLHLWYPVLLWTAITLPILLLLEGRHSGHPAIKYPVYMALLFALQVGLLLANLSGVAVLPSVNADGEGFAFLYVPALAATETGTDAAFRVSLLHGVGALTLAAFLWAAAGLVRAAGHVLAFRRFRRSLSVVPSVEATYEAERLMLSLGLGRPVQVVVVEEAIVPCAAGLLRPRVLLPANLLHEPQQLRMALRHELIHIRRRDNLWNWGEHMIGAVFLIHPLVAVLNRRIAYYREVTCDLEVLHDASIKPKDYAALLFSFLTRPSPQPGFILSMAYTKTQLTRRIDMMRSIQHTPVPARRTGLIAAGLLCGLSLLVACARPQIAQEEPIVYEAVDDMSHFIAEMQTLGQYLEYPLAAKVAGAEGRVVIEFTVNDQGTVVDPVVILKAGHGFEEAALEAIQKVKFTPGMLNGKPVAVRLTMPITFRLPPAEQG